MPTFSFPDQQDAGMPLAAAGSNQLHALWDELSKEKKEADRLRRELGRLTVELVRANQLIADLRSGVKAHRETANQLADLVQKQNGTYDPAVSEAKRQIASEMDFDLLSRRS